MQSVTQQKNYINLTVILKVLSNLLIGLLPLTLVLLIFVNLPVYYFGLFSKYNVYANFTEPPAQLKQKFVVVLDYINLRTSSIDTHFFSQEDVYHLQDVRNLVSIVHIITVLALAVLLFQFLKKNFSRSYLTKIWLAYLAVLIVVAGMFQFDFMANFVGLHTILFSNNQYWLLDPATSNLIKFLPAEIFREAFTLIFTLAIVALVVLLLVLNRKQLTKRFKT